MKQFLYTLLSVCLLALTGCKIDCEEEITILDDGSGSIRIQYILPYKAFSKSDAECVHVLLDGITQRHPELSLSENTSAPHGRYCQELDLTLNFTSIFELERIILEESALMENSSGHDSDSNTQALLEAVFGRIDAGIQPLGVHYDRQLDLSPLFAGKVKNGAILGDAEFRYILTTPFTPDSHNATETANEGKTLIWRIPLKEYYNKPFALQATLANKFFLTAWAIVATLLLACWLLWRGRKRKKRR